MWNVIAAVASTLVAASVLGGLGIRYILVPYFRAQLTDPLVSQMGNVVQIANDALREVRIIVNAWDYHQNWSQREVDRIWQELNSGRRKVSHHD